MLSHLSEKSLLIISDTAMWRVDQIVHVFEPTLREVEELARIFRSVTWIGFDYGSSPASFARPTTKSNIDFVLLSKARGGNTVWQKAKIIIHIPEMLRVIMTYIGTHTIIHTRGPSVPALIAILYSLVDTSRKYWHKYAGNWKQNPAPCAYSFQRYLLRRCRHAVSVNGRWPNEPANVVNVENPCLSDAELRYARVACEDRKQGELINICFVGSLTRSKGVLELLMALSLVPHKRLINEVLIVGDGPLRNELERMAEDMDLGIRFLGNIQRHDLNHVYRASDLIVLPSATEGFPKVIAEAAAFGCIPIVSDVSSIGQYIKNETNGVLLTDTTANAIAYAIDELLIDDSKRIRMAAEIVNIASFFTYERYCERVRTDILKV